MDVSVTQPEDVASGCPDNATPVLGCRGNGCGDIASTASSCKREHCGDTTCIGGASASSPSTCQPDPAAPPEKAEQKKALGNTAFLAKNHREAVRLYSEAIEEAGDLAPAVYFSNRAVCLASLGDFEGACEDAKQALKKPGGATKKVLFQKARAEIRLQRPADAEATLALAKEHGLHEEVTKLLKDEVGKDSPSTASRAAPAAQGAKAASGVTAAQGGSGDPVALAKETGNARYKEGAYREALTEYERALALLAKDDTERRAPLLGNVAAAQLMLRRVKECCASCEQALELDPKNSKIRARLATAQVATGDFEVARATLRATDGKIDEDTVLSNALRQIDEHERALAAADACLPSEPARALSQFADLETKALFDCPALALRMGRCYLELKNYPRVLNTTQQVLRANSRNIDALVLRTEALYRNNTNMFDERQWPEPLEQGQKLLKEALSFDPDHRNAQALRKRLRSLCTKQAEVKDLISNREFEKAREILDDMAQELADNPVVLARLYCERAKLDVRLKDWKMVIKDVGQATYRDHELVQPYLYRSQALQNLERYEDAVKDLEGLFSWHREQGVYEKLQEAKFLLRKKKRPDYYDLLKVPSIASQLEIKKAYKERASEWHPDKKGHLDEACRKNAEEMFKRIGEAYEVLTDATKKDLYDKGYDLEGIEEQIEIKKRRTEQQGCCGGRPGGCR